uniref:Uncharacterized protein n=1 Tax=Anguilla anguilla TaxID=7936 RepID=A0A0E9QVY8_ANGAN
MFIDIDKIMARLRIAVRFSRDTTSVSLMTKRIPRFVSVPIRVAVTTLSD